jgi:hypothetical protein
MARCARDAAEGSHECDNAHAYAVRRGVIRKRCADCVLCDRSSERAGLTRRQVKIADTRIDLLAKFCDLV